MNTNNSTKFFLVLIIIFTCNLGFASFRVGFSSGVDTNIPSRYSGYEYDVNWEKETGFNGGLTGEFDLTHYLAVKLDAVLVEKRFTRERTSAYTQKYYTAFNDLYLTLPVCADFSFGGEQLRGHAYAGLYTGFWLSRNKRGLTFSAGDPATYKFSSFDVKEEFNKKRDNRLNAGLTAGFGVSCKVDSSFAVFGESDIFYDLTSYLRTPEIKKEYRYNTTVRFNIGLMYEIGGAK